MIFGAILAGGTGSRMGNYTLPKQFLPLGDMPIIIHVVEKFLVHPKIDCVVIGVNPEWHQYMLDLIEKYFPNQSNLLLVDGGTDRNSTIDHIICEIRKHSQNDDDIIVTHDAVRPFVTVKMISDNITLAKKYGICDTVIPATDTIVYSENHMYITDIPIRKNVYQGQTPQSFQIKLFEDVYHAMTKEELDTVTDACKMFMLKGHQVYLTEGHVSNIKITYADDYKSAQIMLGSMNGEKMS